MKRGTKRSFVFCKCIGLLLKFCIFFTHLEKLNVLVTLSSESEVAVSSLSQLNLTEIRSIDMHTEP